MQSTGILSEALAEEGFAPLHLVFSGLRWIQSTTKINFVNCNKYFKMHYVYILKCSNNSFYTGCTNNLDNRIEKHNKGQVHYTKDKLPVELVTYIAFHDKYKAYEFEKYLKSGSGIAFRNKRLV
jgi:putative endonuclease